MRGMMVLALAGLLGGGAAAQTPTSGNMPGKAVGSPSVQPVGTRLPQTGSQLPKVGQPPSGYNGSRPNTPFQGDNWPKPDPNLVVAPYPTPNLGTDGFWDKLYKRWLTLFDDKNSTQPTWVPGIARRNRERREKYEAEMRRMRD
jgi:hypothetical protein